ncbi:hypothetical protein [Nocardioides scoriae]|uniref:hypothetical protein n=1 Tax=Nocardioides scoriae TaxID=642780 RepID=UPI0012FCB1FC|nr:hypothetical protein [Nocardioides scoriae]
MIAEDEHDSVLEPGIQVTLSFGATSPSGETLFYNQSTNTLPAKKDPSLPHRLQAVAQIPLPVNATGIYTLTIELSAGDLRQRWSRPLNVRVG